MAETLTSIGSMVGADIKDLRSNTIRTDTTEDQTINSNLEVTGDFSANTVTETSALKFKKDIKLLENGLDIINKFKPVRYTWKKSDIPDIGFIADEVYKFLPELVKIKQDEITGLNYSKITAILVKAVQEQQILLNNLQNEINTLKEQN
jgi:hypothetical protein